jgi:hypothetical protein
MLVRKKNPALLSVPDKQRVLPWKRFGTYEKYAG